VPLKPPTLTESTVRPCDPEPPLTLIETYVTPVGILTAPYPGVVVKIVRFAKPQGGGTAVAFAQYTEGLLVLYEHMPLTSPVNCVVGTSTQRTQGGKGFSSVAVVA